MLRPYATIEKLLRLQDSSSTKSKENGKKRIICLNKKKLGSNLQRRHWLEREKGRLQKTKLETEHGNRRVKRRKEHRKGKVKDKEKE